MQTCIGSDNRLSQKERNRELDGRGDETTCIGSKRERKSKRGPDCETLQGSHMSWVADVHRLR